jgi:Rrf2 family protein
LAAIFRGFYVCGKKALLISSYNLELKCDFSVRKSPKFDRTPCKTAPLWYNLDVMLTKKTEYAIRAMWEIAHHRSGSLATATAIAQRQQIPPKYLPQIVSELSRAALLVTSRGFGGGLRLSRAADKISLLEIIEATQGKLTLFECQVCSYDCRFLPGCQLLAIYQKAQRGLEDTFNNVSLADIKFTKATSKG